MKEEPEKNMVRSLLAALHGLWQVLRHEPAFKYMLLAAAAVIAGTIYFQTSRAENIALVTMTFAVLGLELVNTVLERFLDYLQPEYDERVRAIKDVMAAIVFLVIIGSVLVGVLIFWPHIR